VVLVIAGLLVAAGVGMSVALIDNTRTRTTLKNQEAVKVALQGFIARNGRLPCPAVASHPPTDNRYGLEAPTPGTCTGTVDLAGGTFGAYVVDPAQRGVVPWKALGLTLDGASDGWGSQFTYVVTTTATNKTPDTVAGMRGSIYVHSDASVLPGLPGTGNQLNACSTTAHDNACNKAAAALLISHGRNTLGAFLPSGIQVPRPDSVAAPDEFENTNADRFFVNARAGANFDDLLLPLAPGDLLAPLAAQGVLRSERAVLQERARQVVTLLIAGTIATRTGSSGSYTYTVQAPGSTAAYSTDSTKFTASCDSTAPLAGTLSGAAAQVLDPWGRPFRLARAENTIDSGELCPTPVAIISLGPNGVANGDPRIVAGSDDFVYYSPLAEWKNILERANW
jgi:type II secretory pathway pseudopilin PulG